jgi:hypothetical protein
MIQLNPFITHAFNEAHRFHRLHRFLHEIIGYNENSLLRSGFGRTELFVINGFDCIYIYIKIYISVITCNLNKL